MKAPFGVFFYVYSNLKEMFEKFTALFAIDFLKIVF